MDFENNQWHFEITRMNEDLNLGLYNIFVF